MSALLVGLCLQCTKVLRSAVHAGLNLSQYYVELFKTELNITYNLPEVCLCAFTAASHNPSKCGLHSGMNCHSILEVEQVSNMVSL